MKSAKILAILLVAVMSVSLLATVVKPDKVPKAFEAIWDALVDLQGQIVQEIADLQAALNQEISDRIADVDAEEAARIAADDTLQSNIDAEATARVDADAQLQSNIDAEETARIAADNALQSDLGTEAAARANADTALQNALNQEIADRIADVDAETAARIADVDAEEAARIAEDGTLQAQIDAIQLLPAGVIVMWSGSTIPDGWALCDGSDGTPDLTDKFICGSDGGDLGATGGSATHGHAYSDLPRHSHAATCKAAGEHRHTYSTWFGHGRRSSGTSSAFDYVLYQDKNMLTTKAGSHIHSITINNAGQSGCSTEQAGSLPPYYKLAFIMKL